MISYKGFLALVLFFLYCSSLAHSQNVYTMDGTIIDSITGLAIPYSSLALKNNQGMVINGVVANDKGEFELITKKNDSSLFILVQSLGYKEKKVDLVLSSANGVHLGKILLNLDPTVLSEVNVVSNRDYMENKFDRKVFHFSDNRTGAARTIYDLLRTLPGVLVDEDGTIRFKGAEATIYVDDQLMKFVYPKIDMIPVEKVDKIELIDVAMRTGGDGRGGIINIKLKSNNPDGLSGLLSTGFYSIDFSRIDLLKGYVNLNYKIKKVTFFINTSYDLNYRYNTSETKITNDLYDPKSFQNLSTEDDQTKNSNNNYIGIIYKPSRNTKWYLSYAFLNSNYRSSSKNDFEEFAQLTENGINEYERSTRSKDNQLYHGLTLSYWQQLDTLDSYVKIVCGYNIYNGSNNKNSVYSYSLINSANSDSTYFYRDVRNFYIHSLYANFYYNHSVSKKTRWNLSYNLSSGFHDSTTNNHYQFYDLYLPLYQFSTESHFQQDLSFRFGTEWKHWKFDVGVNLSDEYIMGSFIRYNTAQQDTLLHIRKNYFRLLPSLTISFSFNKESDLKLSLAKTSSLPYFLELCDYVDKNNPYLWNTGNSFIKPIDYYSAYLGYTLTKDNLNFSGEFFFNYTNNEVSTLSIPISSLINLSKPENISGSSNTGFDVSCWYKFNTNLNISLSASLFSNFFDTKSLEATASSYNLALSSNKSHEAGYYFKYVMEYRVKSYYAMLYINYYGKEGTYNGYTKAYLNSSLNLSKKFLNNKFRVTIGLNNILDDLIDHGSYSNNFGEPSNSNVNGSRYKRTFYFSLQFNLAQGDRGTKDYK